MTKECALNLMREHLTNLHSNPNIYEDGTCVVICALEEVIIPMLEVAVEQERFFEDFLDKHPHAFDRVTYMTADELKRVLAKERKENLA